MRFYLNSSPKVEDIMTPRSMLRRVDEGEMERAQAIAENNDFDAVPILRQGEIVNYWSREEKRALPVTRRHRVLHDTRIEDMLPRFEEHLVQFVFYRSEIVGLATISDLNKPLARLTLLHPLLECEQAIVSKVKELGISDDDVAAALGNAAKDAKRLRKKAEREDLAMPLLGFARFGNILAAAVRLKVIDLSDSQIKRLTKLRNGSAHAGEPLVEHKDQIKDLIWALGTCQHILRRI